MLKLKLQYFGHLMQRTDSLEKTLKLEKIEGRRRRGWQRIRWLDDITDSMDMNLSKLRELVRAAKPGVLQSTGSQRVRCDWTELRLPVIKISFLSPIFHLIQLVIHSLCQDLGWGKIMRAQNPSWFFMDGQPVLSAMSCMPSMIQVPTFQQRPIVLPGLMITCICSKKNSELYSTPKTGDRKEDYSTKPDLRELEVLHEALRLYSLKFKYSLNYFSLWVLLLLLLLLLSHFSRVQLCVTP